MDRNLVYICNELRQSKIELMMHIDEKHPNPLILPYILSELDDINSALEKIESGEYGKCEISGELLPADFLNKIPTAKSSQEIGEMEKYCRKPLFS